MDLNDILAVAVKGGASDIHLKAGLPPMFRVHGNLVPLKNGARLSSEEISRMVGSVMAKHEKERFQQNNEVDLAHGVANLARFRANVFRQRGTVGAVFRVIPLHVQTVQQLALPTVLESIALEQRGLVLVTGATGSGKSTTLAAMLEHINNQRTAHVLTIEDPIEFLIPDRRSVINQREVGVDTPGFAPALRAALRQDPDVILVGEMRDKETIEIALTAAETGHLVLSTLHTLDAPETITRIVSVFPAHQQSAVRVQLSSVLRAIISQRLVSRSDTRGRAPALEIMRTTGRIRELIEDEQRAKELHDAIASGQSTYGMQTFDQSLLNLYNSGIISREQALRQASNADDLALRISGVSATSDAEWSATAATRPQQAPPAAASPTAKGARTPGFQRAPAGGSAHHPNAELELDLDDVPRRRF